MTRNFLIPIALSMALFSGLSTSAMAMSKEESQLVYSLAKQPIGIVVGNTCEIRGAVWERGPLAHVDMGLINITTGDIVLAKTNAKGVYSASVPYNGTPQVFQERIASDIVVNKGQSITIKDGGVVCDHRTNAIQLGKEA